MPQWMNMPKRASRHHFMRASRWSLVSCDWAWQKDDPRNSRIAKATRDMFRGIRAMISTLGDNTKQRRALRMTEFNSQMFPVSDLQLIHQDVITCQRCRRLRSYCLDVAATKRRAFVKWNYWGKPVPGFGDPNARLWIIGLAPAAHGANRTGRVFTGDRSGDFLFAALHRAGFASQPTSTSRDDGLRLNDCFISASVRCAPPGNKPSPREQGNCAGFLDREWDSLTHKRVILALGKIAWDATIALAKRNRS